MREVRDLCQRILDTPGPAMPDGAKVLAIARRAKRRRARRNLAAAGLAVAAVTAVAAGAQLLRAPTAPPLIPSAGSPAAGPPHAPTGTAADAYGPRLAQRLTGAVPAGYTGTPASDQPTSTWRLAGSPTSYVSQTRILVSDGTGEGVLTATLVGDGTPAPTGELCAPATTARLASYVDVDAADCRVSAVDGAPIRTGTSPGGAVVAIRFLDGGLLIVDWTPTTSTARPPATQGGPWWQAPGHGRPPLTTSPFTVPQLARLAGDPRMLP